MRRKILYSPDPIEGGAPPSPSPTPSPAAPPAADLVKGSDVKESDAGELVALRRELADEKAKRKTDQVRVSELEDQIRSLKNPTPPEVEKAKQIKRSFLDGCTFMD